jgi:hypothetical protein
MSYDWHDIAARAAVSNRRRRKRRAAFSPLDLSPKAFFDFSDTSRLFQDAAKTTYAANDGDPVRVVLDASGNVYDYTATSDAARPIYHTDGTLGWIEFNGTSQTFGFANALGLTQPFALAVGTRFTDNANNKVLWGDNTPLAYIAASGIEKPRMYAGAILDGSAAHTDDIVFVGVFNGASSLMRVNGTQVAAGNAGAGDPGDLSLGSAHGGSFFAGRLYWAAAFDTLPDDWAALETWGAAKCGI